MRKLFRENGKGLLVGIQVVVFQLCACALISFLTLSNIKLVVMTLICTICIVNLRKMLFIKVK